MSAVNLNVMLSNVHAMLIPRDALEGGNRKLLRASLLLFYYNYFTTMEVPNTLLQYYSLYYPQVGAVNVTAEIGDMYFYPAAYPHKVHDIVGGK